MNRHPLMYTVHKLSVVTDVQIKDIIAKTYLAVAKLCQASSYSLDEDLPYSQSLLSLLVHRVL